MKILQKVEIQDLRWTRETKSCKKIFKPFIDIKTRLENDPFDKASIKANFIKANTSRYVKRTFKKKKKKKKKIEDEIESIKYGSGLKYLLNTVNNAAWKVSKYGAFSGAYFPAFGLNTGKNRPGKNSVFGHFSHDPMFCFKL